MKYEPYDIGFVKGDLVTDFWGEGVGLVTDILWGVQGNGVLPTWVTVIWAGTGKEEHWDAEALKKMKKALDFRETP